MAAPPIHSLAGALLSAEQLYALLRLRVDVFVVEQACPYAELDGLDLTPGTEHLWIHGAAEDEVVATLRILTIGHRPGEGGPHLGAGRRIGRVATSPRHRGKGYGAALMQAALSQLGSTDVVLEAQAHLRPWYAGFGFVRAGENYVEDGIPHVPMRLDR